MSSFKLTYDITDLQRINAAIVGFDTTHIYKSIGEHLKTKTEMSVKREETPAGDSWTPSQRAETTGDKTLVDTKRLINSIRPHIISGGLEFGPDPLPYAAIHQFGGKAGRGRKVDIPQRQYLPLTDFKGKDFSDHDRREIARIVRNGILNQIGKA